jgi:homoserine kinase
MFPDLSSHRLLEMVAYFYARACERLDGIQNELLRILSEQLGCSFDWDNVVRTVVAIHKFRRDQGRVDTPETFEQLLGAIQTSLGLNSTEDARKVFPSLFGYSDMTEEHQATVLLVAAMLEKLFKELLSRMLTTIPLRESTVKYIFKKSRGHVDREQLFAALTGKSLKTVITNSEFYSKWQSIRDARNEFMHGSSFAIGANAAEEAFDIAKESFGVFAELHNVFCIQRT